MAIRIRRAAEADATGAINALRRSIAELCVADHHRDTQEIEAWLGNKNVAAWKNWIARDTASVFVADRNQMVVGVGMVTLRGEILLNYVHPDARFSGVSKAILAEMESELRSNGVQRCQLESTITAQIFYEGCGYRKDEPNSLVMSKVL